MNYAEEYLSFMEEVHKNKHVLNISTITLICNLNVDNVSIQTFIDRFQEPGITMKVQSVVKNGKIDVTRRSKVKRAFFNQVTLNYQDISKKSIKIFSNGKLQMTGITSGFECDVLSNYVLQLIRRTLNNNDIRIVKSYMGMINSNFSVNVGIDLVKLNRVLNENPHVMSIYNPESYPAINVKYEIPGKEHCTSIFVFGTGNIVTTGGKSIEDIKASYRFIHSEISNHYELVCRPDCITDRPIKKEPMLYGYPVRQYMSCVK
jgi:TATA-box binding protein (TBP) (component of TFIID and TFIIIB)